VALVYVLIWQMTEDRFPVSRVRYAANSCMVFVWYMLAYVNALIL